MNLFNECVSELATLETYSPTAVDRIADPYLVRFGTQSASMRIELAEGFHRRARPSPRIEKIYLRIRREGSERPL